MHGEIFRNVTFCWDWLGWSLEIGNGQVMQRLPSDFLESEVMHDWPVTWWFSGDLMPPLQRELQFFREYKKHVRWTCWTWEVTWWFGAPNLQLTWWPCDLVTWWPLCSENFNFFVKMKGMWAEPAAVQLTRWLGDLVQINLTLEGFLNLYWHYIDSDLTVHSQSWQLLDTLRGIPYHWGTRRVN